MGIPLPLAPEAAKAVTSVCLKESYTGPSAHQRWAAGLEEAPEDLLRRLDVPAPAGSRAARDRSPTAFLLTTSRIRWHISSVGTGRRRTDGNGGTGAAGGVRFRWIEDRLLGWIVSFPAPPIVLGVIAGLQTRVWPGYATQSPGRGRGLQMRAPTPPSEETLNRPVFNASSGTSPSTAIWQFGPYPGGGRSRGPQAGLRNGLALVSVISSAARSTAWPHVLGRRSSSRTGCPAVRSNSSSRTAP